MNHKQTSKVPFSIWIAAFSGLVFIIIISDYFHENYKPVETESSSLAGFEPERLKNIHNNGLIVVGTSLVQYGFPYDDEFETLAKKKGITIEFIRFSRSSGKPPDFEILGDAILNSKPRWVFLQAEPFFLDMHRTFSYQWLEHLRNNVHFLLEQIIIETNFLNTDCNPVYQNDLNLRLDEVATIEIIKNERIQYLIKPPVFSEYFESFLKQAKENNIKVILLEMNRSKEGNEYFGKAFRAQLNKTLQQVSKHYQIPLWQFRSDLSLNYYVDRAHLNRKGRAVFSDWFLSKLAQDAQEKNHND